jgi:GTP cyclohydrolase II
MDVLSASGGILLYLRQEGRGIGLYNKLDAYRLQDTGLDTYQANRQLGLGDDLRSFSVAAQMLLALGHEQIDLLSNNPDKRLQLERAGVEVVQQVRTGVFANRYNARYLRAKHEVGHHLIDVDGLLAAKAREVIVP